MHREGMLATFDRQRAIVREDIRLLTADHAHVANSNRLAHGGALRHEPSPLQRAGYCGAPEAGKEAALCGGRGSSKAASWSACYYLQMWLVVINN